MNELPDEIWSYILDLTLDWKRSHKQKMKLVRLEINGCYKERYERWTVFPPWPNTTDIILDEYVNNERLRFAPPPNLELTSITKYPNSNIYSTGWWCGYGWKKRRRTII